MYIIYYLYKNHKLPLGTQNYLKFVLCSELNCTCFKNVDFVPYKLYTLKVLVLLFSIIKCYYYHLYKALVYYTILHLKTFVFLC